MMRGGVLRELWHMFAGSSSLVVGCARSSALMFALDYVTSGYCCKSAALETKLEESSYAHA
eukprot:422482-Amphidinium_carterae.1